MLVGAAQQIAVTTTQETAECLEFGYAVNLAELLNLTIATAPECNSPWASAQSADAQSRILSL
jgi:hypothetical protein